MQEIIQGPYTIFVSEAKDGTARAFDDVIYTSQVHGDAIAVLEAPMHFIPGEHDAIISKLNNIKIGVLLADCNGIVLMGKEWFGVVHAGWKGLHKHIIEKTANILKERGEEIENLYVYVGPSIRACCYEVGPEFTQYFDQKYLITTGTKYHLDMIKYIQDSLTNIGIQEDHITIHPDCTYCTDKYFSYRKHNNNQRITVAVKKHI